MRRTEEIKKSLELLRKETEKTAVDRGFMTNWILDDISTTLAMIYDRMRDMEDGGK